MTRILMFLAFAMQVVPSVQLSEAAEINHQQGSYADQLLALGIPQQQAVQHLIGYLLSQNDINTFGFDAAYEMGVRDVFDTGGIAIIDNNGRAVGVIWNSGSQVDIYVHPSQQGHGYGRQALARYINGSDSDINIFISTNNIASLRLIRRVLERNRNWVVRDVQGNNVNMYDIDDVIRRNTANPVASLALDIESLGLTIRP